MTTLIKLDRELIKEYEVPIMASDGGGRPAFTTVRVKVADENDNAPLFLLKEYKAAIYSNYSTSISFLKVITTILFYDLINSSFHLFIYKSDIYF